MSKKVISLLLSLMLMVSMVAVAAVSVSAETDEQGRYTPSEGTDTNRYYFYMPSDWFTDNTATGGIYWWQGTDPADPWPGYKAQPADAANIFYCDVPVDVTTIIWNNAVDGGEDASAPIYASAMQTINIGSEFYDAGESDYYPDGVDSFDNMIYVLNPDMTDVAESGKATCGGEWYYYYGNGEYGLAPTRDEAIAEECLFSTEYQPPVEEETTTEPVEETTASEQTTAPETTAEVEESTILTESTIEGGGSGFPEQDVASLTVNATSNLFPEATAMYDAFTNEVTVTYYFNSSKDILNAQWTLTYDPEVLTLSDKSTAETITPGFVGGGSMINTGLLGMIKFNASNLSLYSFGSEDAVFATVVFDLNESALTPAATTVDLTVEALTVSEVSPETGYTITEEEVVLVNNSIVNDNEQTATVGVSLNTELTPDTFVPATTAEPTEATTEATEATTEATEATTEATEATEATTEATEATTEATEATTEATEATTEATEATTEATEATTEATEATTEATEATTEATEATTEATEATTEATEATTEATAATSSTDATSTVGGTSTADTSTADNAQGGSTGGTVQTGDSSLAIIILTLLCGATGVMFVLRKREML